MVMDEKDTKLAIWELCDKLGSEAGYSSDLRNSYTVNYAHLGIVVTQFRKLGINNSECIILRHDAYTAVMIRDWPGWTTTDRNARMLGHMQFYVTGDYQKIMEAVIWLRMSSLM
jgi:hypothetical protein